MKRLLTVVALCLPLTAAAPVAENITFQRDGAKVHVTLTDDPPMAQAFVIIEAVPEGTGRD